jgi:next-to-BRCA1 protein 1
MFVIKATLKDETRRLAFEGSRFPPYGEVQHKVGLTITSNIPHIPTRLIRTIH